MGEASARKRGRRDKGGWGSRQPIPSQCSESFFLRKRSASLVPFRFGLDFIDPLDALDEKERAGISGLHRLEEASAAVHHTTRQAVLQLAGSNIRDGTIPGVSVALE